MVAIGNIGGLIPLTPSALAVRALEQAVNAQLGVQARPPIAQDVVQLSLQARTQAQTTQPNLAIGLNFANALNQPASANALTLNLAVPPLPLEVGAPLVAAEPQIQAPAAAATDVAAPVSAQAAPPVPVEITTVAPNLVNLTAAEIANRQAATLGINAGEFRANFSPLETLYARGEGSDLLVNPEVAEVTELKAIPNVERQPPNALMSPAVQDALALIGVQRAAPGFEAPEAFPAVTSRLAAEAYRSAAA